MARASTQHKLDRVRPPRVHITYDVEIGDAIVMRELPFMLGVLGDFTGMPTQPLPRLRERKFIEVTPDNFDAVLEGMSPRIAFAVDNKLTDQPDAGQIRVDLNFKSLDDFDPVNVARQVRPLSQLLDLRVKLTDLLGALQGNDRLDEVLIDVLSDADKVNKLRAELGPTQPVAAIIETSIEPSLAVAAAIAESAAARAAKPVEQAESTPPPIEAAATGTEPHAEVSDAVASLLGQTEAVAHESDAVASAPDSIAADTDGSTDAAEFAVETEAAAQDTADVAAVDEETAAPMAAESTPEVEPAATEGHVAMEAESSEVEAEPHAISAEHAGEETAHEAEAGHSTEHGSEVEPGKDGV